MLVLSRKVSEALLIGQDVRITVLKIERSHVRIGIEAPGSVTILRAELTDDGLGLRIPSGSLSSAPARGVPAVAEVEVAAR